MKPEIRSLIENAIDRKDWTANAGQPFWTADAVQSLCFEDPKDIDASGVVSVFGDCGTVRLEMTLPADRAAEVIEYVTRGRPLRPVASVEAEASGPDPLSLADAIALAGLDAFSPALGLDPLSLSGLPPSEDPRTFGLDVGPELAREAELARLVAEQEEDASDLVEQP